MRKIKFTESWCVIGFLLVLIYGLFISFGVPFSMWFWPAFLIAVPIILSAACNASSNLDYYTTIQKTIAKKDELDKYEAVPGVYSYIMRNTDNENITVLEEDFKPRNPPKVKSKALFCEYCGTRRVKNAIYCYNCGSKLDLSI